MSKKEKLPEVVTEDGMSEALSQGHALVKLQDDQLQQIAAREPRPSGEMLLEQALKELDLFSTDLTAENFYSIPYNDGQGGKTYVQGISVRGSDNLARIYRKLVCTQGILEVGENHAIVVGTCLDYEAEYMQRVERRCSRIQVRRGGNSVRLDENRWNMLIAAEASKAKRNATLNVLPSYFKAGYFNRCLELATGKLKAAAKAAGRKPWQEMLKAFEPMGVSRADLEGMIGHPLPKVTDDELGRLRGIYNGIKSGDLDRASVFAKAPDKQGTGDVDAALAAGAETTAGAEADPAVAGEEQGVHPPREKGPREGANCPDCNRSWEIWKTDIGHAVGCKFRKQ